MQLASIKLGVKKIYPTMKPSSKEYKAAVVLLTAANLGTTSEAELVEFTGYTPSFIRTIIRNMTNARVFVGNRVNADWFSKNGASAFYGDVSLALGNVRITNRSIPARFNALNKH